MLLTVCLMVRNSAGTFFSSCSDEGKTAFVEFLSIVYLLKAQSLFQERRGALVSVILIMQAAWLVVILQKQLPAGQVLGKGL